jgi:hypothetical protein
MSKRLQVLVDEPEWEELREAAGRDGVTVSEWVRRALRAARRTGPEGDLGSKLAAIRTAAGHRYPSADIDQMLAEIESGFGPGGS